MTDQPTVYRIEFGKVGETYPVPPITLEHTDPNEFARKVVAHAIPYLTPALTEMGRPELADCFFRRDSKDPTYGDFLWIDLVGDRGAQFCPARITPVADEDTHVVADGSDDPEHVDDCPGCVPAP